MSDTHTDRKFAEYCVSNAKKTTKGGLNIESQKKAVIITFDIDSTLLHSHFFVFVGKNGKKYYDRKAATAAHRRNENLLNGLFESDPTRSKVEYRKNLNNYGLFCRLPECDQLFVAYLRPNCLHLLQSLIQLRHQLMRTHNCIVKIAAATHGTAAYAQTLINALTRRLAHYCDIQPSAKLIFDCVLAREVWQNKMKKETAIEAYYGKSLDYIYRQCLSTTEKFGLKKSDVSMYCVDDNPWVWARADNNNGSVLYVTPWRVESGTRVDYLKEAKADNNLYSLEQLLTQLITDPSLTLRKMFVNLSHTGVMGWLDWFCKNEIVVETIYKMNKDTNERRHCLMGALLMLTVFRLSNPKKANEMMDDNGDEIRKVILGFLDFQCYLRSETGQTRNWTFADWLNACRPVDIIQFSEENKPTKLSHSNHKRAKWITDMIATNLFNADKQWVSYRHMTTIAPLKGVFKCVSVSNAIKRMNAMCKIVCKSLSDDDDKVDSAFQKFAEIVSQ